MSTNCPWHDPGPIRHVPVSSRVPWSRQKFGTVCNMMVPCKRQSTPVLPSTESPDEDLSHCDVTYKPHLQEPTTKCIPFLGSDQQVLESDQNQFGCFEESRVCIITDKVRVTVPWSLNRGGFWRTKIKLEVIDVSHTLGGVGQVHVQVRGKGGGHCQILYGTWVWWVESEVNMGRVGVCQIH
jgi:hypothetical protein